MSNPRDDESGQSTIEFALTIMLLLSFAFFYIHLSFVFAFGNFTQYATFMSARAYLAAGPDREDQAARAKRVIVRMLKQAGSPGADRWPFIAQGTGGGEPNGVHVGAGPQFSPDNPALAWMEGVRYEFKAKLFLMALGSGESEGSTSFTLTSESWLGREPTQTECEEELSRRAEGRAIYDNGC